MGTLLSGRKTVTTAGTAVRLSSSQPVGALAIQALSNNTDKVVVGGSDVVAALSTRKGIYLSPGDVVSIDTDDLGDVWIDSVVNGEGVTYLGVGT